MEGGGSAKIILNHTKGGVSAKIVCTFLGNKGPSSFFSKKSQHSIEVGEEKDCVSQNVHNVPYQSAPHDIKRCMIM